MNTIIAVSGTGNTGKTSTLKQLIEQLKNLDEHPKITEKGKDELAYLTIQIRNKSQNIVITTSGDNETEIQNNFKFCQEKNIATINTWIVACRTKGSSIKRVIDIAKKEQCTLFIYQKSSIKQYANYHDSEQSTMVKSALITKNNERETLVLKNILLSEIWDN